MAAAAGTPRRCPNHQARFHPPSHLCTHPTPAPTHLVDELVEGVLPVGAGLTKVDFARLQATKGGGWREADQVQLVREQGLGSGGGMCTDHLTVASWSELGSGSGILRGPWAPTLNERGSPSTDTCLPTDSMATWRGRKKGGKGGNCQKMRAGRSQYTSKSTDAGRMRNPVQAICVPAGQPGAGNYPTTQPCPAQPCPGQPPTCWMWEGNLESAWQ